MQKSRRDTIREALQEAAGGDAPFEFREAWSALDSLVAERNRLFRRLRVNSQSWHRHFHTGSWLECEVPSCAMDRWAMGQRDSITAVTVIPLNHSTEEDLMDTITFDRDGKTYVAVVDEPVVPGPDRMIVEYEGGRYAISIPLGQIAGHPNALIAHPVEDPA